MLVSGQNDRHYQKFGCFSFGESRSLSPDNLLERVISPEKDVKHRPVVVVAEWLRRRNRNPLGSPRAGSSHADYEELFFRFLALISECFGNDFLTTNKFDLNQLIPLNLQRKVKNLKHGIVFHNHFENLKMSTLLKT